MFCRICSVQWLNLIPARDRHEPPQAVGGGGIQSLENRETLGTRQLAAPALVHRQSKHVARHPGGCSGDVRGARDNPSCEAAAIDRRLSRVTGGPGGKICDVEGTVACGCRRGELERTAVGDSVARRRHGDGLDTCDSNRDRRRSRDRRDFR